MDLLDFTLYPWQANEFSINVSLVHLMHVKRCKQINKYGQLNQKRAIKFGSGCRLWETRSLYSDESSPPPHCTQESFTLHAWYVCLLFIYIAFLLGWITCSTIVLLFCYVDTISIPHVCRGLHICLKERKTSNAFHTV